MKKLLAAFVLLAVLLPWRNVLAADLALVLLTDVSGSMGDDEFKLVKEGYRAAFADPEVLAAIAKNSRGVAVAYVEFSDENSVMVVKGWDLLTDGASALAFGNAVAAAPRSSTGNTALSNGTGGGGAAAGRQLRWCVWSSMWPAIIPAMAGNRPMCANASSRRASP
jgi:hypothetical protein